MTQHAPTESGRHVRTLENIVRESVLTTCKSALGAEPTIEQSSSPSSEDSLIGIISFTGTVAWTFMLGLPRTSAVALIEKFAGFPLEFESAEMGDAVGEFVNVIAGDLVARCDAESIKAAMSLPTTARGHNVRMMDPQGTVSRDLSFQAVTGPFWVRFATAIPAECVKVEGHGVVCPKCGATAPDHAVAAT